MNGCPLLFPMESIHPLESRAKRLFLYRSQPGKKGPVEKYLDKLFRKNRSDAARLNGIFEDFVRYGRLPVLQRKKLRGSLWEFRAPRPFQPRVAHASLGGDVVVLLHGIVKKDDAWNGADLDTADDRLRSILEWREKNG